MYKNFLKIFGFTSLFLGSFLFVPKISHAYIFKINDVQNTAYNSELVWGKFNNYDSTQFLTQTFVANQNTISGISFLMKRNMSTCGTDITPILLFLNSGVDSIAGRGFTQAECTSMLTESLAWVDFDFSSLGTSTPLTIGNEYTIYFYSNSVNDSHWITNEYMDVSSYPLGIGSKWSFNVAETVLGDLAFKTYTYIDSEQELGGSTYTADYTFFELYSPEPTSLNPTFFQLRTSDYWNFWFRYQVEKNAGYYFGILYDVDVNTGSSTFNTVWYLDDLDWNNDGEFTLYPLVASSTSLTAYKFIIAESSVFHSTSSADITETWLNETFYILGSETGDLPLLDPDYNDSQGFIDGKIYSIWTVWQTFAPFSYFFQISDRLENVDMASSSQLTLTLQNSSTSGVPFSITMFDNTSIDRYYPEQVRNLFRELLKYGMYFGFLTMLFFTIKNSFNDSI